MKFLNKIFLILLSVICFYSQATDLTVSSYGKKSKQKKEKKTNSKNKPEKIPAKKRPAGDITSTDIEVLKANKLYNEEKKDYDYAIKWLDRIIAVSSDSEEIQQARLEIANFNYLLGEFEKAGDGYKEYLKLYPGSDNAEFAKYRQVASNFYRMAPSDRDQSLTIETTLMAKEYLENGVYKKYIKEVKSILEKSLINLLDSEINVFELNLKSANYEGAQRRLDYIKKKYLPELPKTDSIINDLENSLEQSKKRGRYVQIYKKERTPLLDKWKKKSFKQQF